MKEKQEKMLDIWFFVALVLAIYGVILTVIGIYFSVNPYEKTALAHYNPNLWWGLIMLVFGVLFFFISHKARQSNTIEKTTEETI